MKIMLELPDEFITHYNNTKFIDSLSRIECDIGKQKMSVCTQIRLSGLYERELVTALKDAFQSSTLILDK